MKILLRKVFFGYLNASGSNENFNGLLRQYIPKKRPLSTVTDNELKIMGTKLNNRPRKRLGFKKPNEVFYLSFNCVALRV
jgi:IS30 family transposase